MASEDRLTKTESSSVQGVIIESATNISSVLKRGKKIYTAAFNGLSQQDLEEFIAKHLFERIPYYTKAQHHLSTDEASVEELCQKVQNFLT